MTARRRARQRWGIQLGSSSDAPEHRSASSGGSRIYRALNPHRWFSRRFPAVVSPLRLLRESLVEVTMLRERRSRHPIDRLSREFDHVCTGAVDTQQIAASLEAEGINDRIARDRFAVGNVFELAAELRHRVPRRVGSPDTGASRPHGPAVSGLALILRGPVYLSPVLFFLPGGGLLRSGDERWVAVLALLLAWMLNQGFGVFVHSFIGRGEPARARRAARQSLIAGTLIVTLVAWPIAALAFDNGWLCLIAAVQTAYLMASASLLALSEDRRLLVSLAPGLAVAIAAILTDSVPDSLGVVAALGTVAAVVAALVRVTRNPAVPWLLTPPRAAARLASMHALLGGVWAGMIGVAGLVVAPDPDVMATVSIAAVPVVVAMGFAELQLVGFRSTVRRSLVATSDLAHFADEGRKALLEAFASYAVVLLGLALIVTAFARTAGHLDVNQFRLAVAFVFLGCAMFAGMALVAMGRAGLTLFASAATLALTIPTVAGWRALPADPAIPYGAACLTLFLLLLVVALDTAGRPVVYR